MPNPLVFKNGYIQEEALVEAGVYPKVYLTNGNLVAGGSGYLLYLIDGAITQIASFEGVFWDTFAQWDGGAASWGVDWDVYGGALWDDNNSTWV